MKPIGSVRPPAIPPRSSSTPSRLERSASTGNCPDFLDSDIDALIAQFIIPPPPTSSSSVLESNENNEHTFAKSLSGAIPQHQESNIPHEKRAVESMEEFSHLIIPPPPTNVSSSSPDDQEDIPVVPPVPNSDMIINSEPTNKSEQKSEASAKKRLINRHKRSSSLDLASIKIAQSQNQFSANSRSKSLDANQNNIEVSQENESETKETSSKSFGTGVSESPSVVSQKLHSLLKSLPNFGPIQQHGSENDLVRTGSLRIHRTTSLDLNANITTDIASNGTPPLKPQASNSIPTFTRSSSLRIKKGLLHTPRSQSLDRSNKSHGYLIERSSSETTMLSPAKTGSEKELDKTSLSGGSESFASLKAKLKDYRDMLLNRNKTSASKKYAVGDESPRSTSDSGKGSLRRSNSFSKIRSTFVRRSSKSDDETTSSISLVTSDDNWELKEAKPVTLPNGDDIDASVEKKVPVVRDTLSLNRPSLRPMSNNILSQVSIRFLYKHSIPYIIIIYIISNFYLYCPIISYVHRMFSV